MQETDFLSKPTFSNYISNQPEERFVYAYNEDADVSAQRCVGLTNSSKNVFGVMAMVSGRHVGGVATENIPFGDTGTVQVSGIAVVAAGDTTTGSQISNNAGLAVAAGVQPYDPRVYIGEALSYDSVTNTKVVVLRLG